EPQLALAAPVREKDRVVAVALVQLDPRPVTGPVGSAAVGDDTYLALRQRGHSLVERGNADLAGGAEALAKPVAGSDLRVAAAVPDVAGAPFGLGAVGCLVAALIFALLALLAWRAPQLAARRGAAAGDTDADADDDATLLTLAESAALSPDDETPAVTKEAPIPPLASSG